MRHFERAVLAARYDAFRPQVHAEVFDRLELPDLDSASLILDVACGTRHSTAPLLNLAANVVGCDVSESMLQHARRRCPAATFIAASSDALPLAEDSVDLGTVAMAFHWFDQRAFLAEAARVLRPGGSLVIYNYFFAGEMVGNPDFGAWVREGYLQRFPPAARVRGLVADLSLDEHGFEFVEAHTLSHLVDMSAKELRNYLTTQSNIGAALAAGMDLAAIDAFLDEELALWFAGSRASFEYPGQVTRLVRSSPS